MTIQSIEFPLIGPGGEPVDFRRTISGHGVTSLPPMTVDEAANTITVSGHVRDLPNGTINEAADVLELRLNAEGFTWQSGDRPGRRDLREQLPAAEIVPDGTFTHVFNVSDADAANASSLGFEQALEWSKAVGEAAPPAIFVSDAPDPEAAVPQGCPPLSSSTP